MNSYELAPATAIIAVYCACCSRPLLDAKSVETGMGPHCRAKHGYSHECTEEQRIEANRLVHGIAVAQSGDAVNVAIAKLFALGFEKLADRIAKRLGAVTLTIEGDRYVLKAPYNERAVNVMRNVPGRRWDREAKVNTFPISSRAALWTALSDCYAGSIAKGPKGFFTIATVSMSSIPTDHYLANKEEIDRQEDAKEARKAALDEHNEGRWEGMSAQRNDHQPRSFISVHHEPPAGSWAETARLMASSGDNDEGIDWDAWKDQMKDQELLAEVAGE